MTLRLSAPDPTKALPWAVLLAGLALYGVGVSPGLAILDSGEFLGVAATLGVAHPTGYPLYAVLGHLATLFPFFEKAFLTNLVSAVCGATAAFFLAAAAADYGRAAGWGKTPTTVAALAAGVLTLTGRTLWAVSTLAEVYALNAALWGALLWAALRVRRCADGPSLLLFALIAGLSCANHMSLVLFIPFAAAIAWPGRSRGRALAPLLAPATAAFALGASVNLFVPIRSYQTPPFDWNHPSNLRFWIGHAVASQYRGNWLENGAAGVKEAWATFTRGFVYNGAPLAAFAAVTMAASAAIKGRRLVGAALTLYAASYLSYCFLYDIPDILYYFIPVHVAVAFLAATGLAQLAAWAEKARFRPAAWVAAAMVCAAGAWAIWANAPYSHRRCFLFAERYSSQFLAALPHRALVFPSGDTNTFTSWYNVFVRGRRPDVAIVDQIRLTGRGYLGNVATRYPDLSFPSEEDMEVIAAKAVARGDFGPDEDFSFAESDDFILPEIIAAIIADNQGRRPMFWGLGDAGRSLRTYLVPYDVVLEITADPPDQTDLVRRGRASAAAFRKLTSYVAGEGAAELQDPFLAKLLSMYAGSLGEKLTAYGLTSAAGDVFSSYVAVQPGDAAGHLNLGNVYVMSGNPAEASRCFRRAAALAPEDVEIRRRLIHTLIGAGHADQALAEAVAFEGINGPGGMYLKGVVYRETGEAGKSRAALAAAAPFFGKNAEFWWEKGLTDQELRDWKAAESAFSEAVKLQPDSPRFKAARGGTRVRLGNYDGDTHDLEAAVAADAGDARSQYNLACLYSLVGNQALALTHLDAAMRLNPGRYVPMALMDEDLADCRDDAAFGALIGRYAVPAGDG